MVFILEKLKNCVNVCFKQQNKDIQDKNTLDPHSEMNFQFYLFVCIHTRQ